eukprot:TRINITY_DN915_c0_g1_i1.p1 TRINITY_DN915_c0_g1~~TRINITY_DN915_c0_g1_i1.p1  ORF type:complete len:373 (-),score=86.63 TRINITY_DN915_c0_g1_i1:133-1251(-)
MAGAEKTSSTIFVGNIPYDATEDDVRRFLNEAAKVVSFRMVFDKETRQPKGYGFCDFADNETAINAMKALSEMDFNGRKLRLDLTDSGFAGKGAGKGSRSAPPPTSSTLGSGNTMLALPAPGGSGGQLALPGPAGSLPPGVKPMTGPRGAGAGSATVNLGSAAPGVVDTTTAAVTAVDSSTPEEVMASVQAHTNIAQTVAAMPQAHLQLLLGTMQKLTKEAPEHARAMLLEHPQLSYALLHAQFILGLNVEPALPPDAAETQQLRAEAVQRVMTNAKAMGGKAGMPFRPQMATMQPGGPGGMMMMPGMMPGMMMAPGMPGVAGPPQVQRPMMPVMPMGGPGSLSKAGGIAVPPPPPPVPGNMQRGPAPMEVG